MTGTQGTQWHADANLLRLYADGRLDQVGQAAVETHVTTCAACRAEAARLVSPIELTQLWDGVARVVTAPKMPLLLRLLSRLGVRDTDLVILRASGNMWVPYTLATASAVVFAITSSWLSTELQQVFYLAVAPLMPALLIAGAYDTTDPLRDLTESTPHSKMRVAMLRTTLATTVALPLVALIGLVPEIEASVVTWLLPALLIAVVILLLMTWVNAPIATAAVSVVWLAIVVALRISDGLDAADGPRGQLVFAILLVATVPVLAHRLEFQLRKADS